MDYDPPVNLQLDHSLTFSPSDAAARGCAGNFGKLQTTSASPDDNDREISDRAFASDFLVYI